jgi:hypothetical protein
MCSQRVVEERYSLDSTSTKSNYNDNQSNKNSTTPPKKRLMTAAGVDALTQQLDALCLGGGVGVGVGANNQEQNKQQETAPVSPKSVSFETETDTDASDGTSHGRFDQPFYSPKTHCHVTVKRSYRLV